VWKVLRRSDRRSGGARWLAFASGIFWGVNLIVWHRAIALIGAGLSTVLANVQVVFVGIAAWVLYREKLRVYAVVTIAVVFMGVGLISGLGRPDAHGADPIAGAIFGVLAGMCYAVFLLTFRASNRDLVPSVGPLLDATLGAALASLAWGLLDGSLGVAIGWSSHTWLLVMALVPHVGGWLLISTALPRLPALDTSVMLLLQPMATVLWALLIFGEWLSGIQWSGVGLVLCGIAVLSLRRGAAHFSRDGR
jgi:drug/metabolite transporter (DMT)-like permease